MNDNGKASLTANNWSKSWSNSRETLTCTSGFVVSSLRNAVLIFSVLFQFKHVNFFCIVPSVEQLRGHVVLIFSVSKR